MKKTDRIECQATSISVRKDLIEKYQRFFYFMVFPKIFQNFKKLKERSLFSYFTLKKRRVSTSDS